MAVRVEVCEWARHRSHRVFKTYGPLRSRNRYVVFQTSCTHSWMRLFAVFTLVPIGVGQISTVFVFHAMAPGVR